MSSRTCRLFAGAAAFLFGWVAATGGARLHAAEDAAAAPLNARAIARLEAEAAAVTEAAARGGAEGLAEALESCWRASAGYGVEALAPCAVRERAALELIALLRPKIGPLAPSDGAAARFSDAAAEARIAQAYAARDAAPPSRPQVAALLRYDLSRRIEPSWAEAPTLATIGKRVADARRASEERGVEALRNESSGCWVRLALNAAEPPDERAAAAWECRLADLIAGGAPQAAAEARERTFQALTAAPPEASAAVAAAAAVLWPRP